MTNRLKQSLFSSQKELQSHRLYIEQKQIRQFWQSRTLTQMQQILALREEKIIQYIWQYFIYYASNKKNISIKDAYCVKKDEEILMYVYDCRIFKSQFFNKDDNELLSSFLMAYKQEMLYPYQSTTNFNTIKDIYQFVNPPVFGLHKFLFKCKASCLLKIYPLFRQLNMEAANGDIVILDEEIYYKFIYSWMHFTSSVDVEPMVRHLFRGILILMHNQILLEFSKTLSQKEKQFRRYEKPVAIFEKPKLKETYTMVQQGLGDVEWNTLKIYAFKFKYKVVEDERSYVCYRVKEEEQFNENMHKRFDEMNEEDVKIVLAFDKKRKNQRSESFY